MRFQHPGTAASAVPPQPTASCLGWPLAPHICSPRALGGGCCHPHLAAPRTAPTACSLTHAALARVAIPPQVPGHQLQRRRLQPAWQGKRVAEGRTRAVGAGGRAGGWRLASRALAEAAQRRSRQPSGAAARPGQPVTPHPPPPPPPCLQCKKCAEGFSRDLTTSDCIQVGWVARCAALAGRRATARTGRAPQAARHPRHHHPLPRPALHPLPASIDLLQASLPGCEVVSRNNALYCDRCQPGWVLNRQTRACVQCTAPGAASCSLWNLAVPTACLPVHGMIVDPVTRAKSCQPCDPANVGCAVCNGDITKVCVCVWWPLAIPPAGSGAAPSSVCTHATPGCCSRPLPRLNPPPLSPAVLQVRAADRPRGHPVLRAGHRHRHLRQRAPVSAPRSITRGRGAAAARRHARRGCASARARHGKPGSF